MIVPRREEIITHKVDNVTVMLYCFMVFWGWLNIYSASYAENHSIFDPDYNSGRQLMFMVLSAFLIFAILIIDMRFYETFAYIIFGAVMFILLLMPVIGKEVGGNRSWLGIGSLGVQPSEFA